MTEEVSGYLQDMRQRVVDLELTRAEFMARPSIIQGIVVHETLGGLYQIYKDGGVLHISSEKSPDDALRLWDDWFLNGTKGTRHDK